MPGLLGAVNDAAVTMFSAVHRFVGSKEISEAPRQGPAGTPFATVPGASCLSPEARAWAPRGLVWKHEDQDTTAPALLASEAALPVRARPSPEPGAG